MRSYDDNLKIEKAIKFLVFQIDKSEDNPKPVIYHSVRTALHLDKYEYPTAVVVAGLLHDLLEDSVADLKIIEKEFGQEITDLVKANSFDKSITDKKQRYVEVFGRCLKAGREALLIKTADILDNADYYSLVKDREVYRGLIEKLEYFMNLTRELLKSEPIYTDLLNKYKFLTTENEKIS